jgi:hypothetical protein
MEKFREEGQFGFNKGTWDMSCSGLVAASLDLGNSPLPQF